jgi:hypothetical protein
MFKPHAMDSISPVSASLYGQDATSANQASQITASIEHTILQDASRSMSALLSGLATSGTVGRHINALA